ncbi:Solute carrier family 35 member F6 [Chlorella sorokiniana]|uniref:Solute carrier family 35 member F6 n=1 Tax=Chlorella sorokiniana TaxID=3076 RepID=A0A2P6TBN5_CHLSO|nr:Solute carrier family 35 member F6 [Chlorella sorokiniana]|eukprot:PRW18296.1 Solute carrier family 35 member F6 [Chlorella sorokiniana]
MFLGEALCLLPFAARRWYKARYGPPLDAEEAAARAHRLRRAFWVFGLPAMCDAGATTLLNLGLFYTYASVFQMLRGTLVIFAGLLTILLLKRRLHSHHWLGMVLICAGAALVGASSVIYDRSGTQAAAQLAVDGGGSSSSGSGSTVAAGLRRLLMLLEPGPGRLRGGGGASGAAGTAPDPLLGNVLVVLAQLLAASQFIVEEKYLVKYRAPVLLAVGMEGFWGLALCSLALPALQHIRGGDGLPLDSFTAAWAEVKADFVLQWTTALTVTSIAFFNFFGVSVTKNLSGAARATIDACRTLFIWLFALRMGWEQFHMLQVVGFAVLLSGTSIYNELLRSCLPPAEPHSRRRRRSSSADAEAGLQQPLLAGQAAEGEVQQQAGGRPGVRFAEPPPASRPIAAGRQGPGGHARYTMARSVTILPAALDPHSLASVPSTGFGSASFTFSVPADVSTGSRRLLAPRSGGELGEEEEGEGLGGLYASESEEASEWDPESRDSSQHGPGARPIGRGRS